jgi:hypothetical protein
VNDYRFFDALREFSDVYVYGAILTALIVLIVLGRYVIRSIVNRRVKSIQSGAAMTFDDVKRMREKGMIDEEEYKRVRSRLAQSELKARTGAGGKSAAEILATIERNPEAARELIPPSGERARAAMAGLGRKGDAAESGDTGASETPIVESAPRAPSAPSAAKTPEQFEWGDPIPKSAREAPDRPKPEPTKRAPTPAPQAANRMPKVKDDSLIAPRAPDWFETQTPPPARRTPPTEPMATPPIENELPKPNVAPAPSITSPDPPAPEKQTRDLDALLARGLISREEYDRFVAFFDKAGESE